MSVSPAQRVAVLGPQSAIGRAVAQQVLVDDGHVAGIGRACALDNSPYVSFHPCDLTQFATVRDALLAARDTLGALTGIVNCAGSMTLKPAHLTSQEAYEETIAANLTTAFATVQAARPLGWRREAGDNRDIEQLLSWFCLGF